MANGRRLALGLLIMQLFAAKLMQNDVKTK